MLGDTSVRTERGFQVRISSFNLKEFSKIAPTNAVSPLSRSTRAALSLDRITLNKISLLRRREWA